MNKLVYKCFVLKVNDTTLKIYDINIFTIFLPYFPYIFVISYKKSKKK